MSDQLEIPSYCPFCKGEGYMSYEKALKLFGKVFVDGHLPGSQVPCVNNGVLVGGQENWLLCPVLGQ